MVLYCCKLNNHGCLSHNMHYSLYIGIILTTNDKNHHDSRGTICLLFKKMIFCFIRAITLLIVVSKGKIFNSIIINSMLYCLSRCMWNSCIFFSKQVLLQFVSVHLIMLNLYKKRLDLYSIKVIFLYYHSFICSCRKSGFEYFSQTRLIVLHYCICIMYKTIYLLFYLGIQLTFNKYLHTYTF